MDAGCRTSVHIVSKPLGHARAVAVESALGQHPLERGGAARQIYGQPI